MTPLAAYLLLFVAVGVGFIFVHLLAGKLIRPSKKNPEKDTIYECGEPTIGSAWVQFDLRFYVVALLFVIFDVEVAFFFPWAEVFGKANAIRSAPPPETPEQYGDYAAKVLDLTAGGKEREFWEQVKGITEGLAALSPEQVGKIQEQGKNLTALRKKAAEELTAESKRLVAEARKLPPDQQRLLQRVVMPAPLGGGGGLAKASGPDVLDRALNGESGRLPEVIDLLGNMPLESMRRLRAVEVELIYQPIVQKAMAKILPAALESQRKLAGRLEQEFRKAADDLLAAAGEQRRALAGFTGEMIEDLGGKDPARVAEVRALALRQTRALKSQAESARSAADNLAWLAFFEILVFFGVLLVGFAYLWRRGDLAWVRSTAAESPAAIRELEAVGKGRETTVGV